MGTKFTPGPWAFTECASGRGFDVHRAPHGDGMFPNSNDVGSIISVYGADPTEIERANARLIAAAPDLLRALTNLYARCLRELADPEDVGDMQDAAAAITKATT